MATTTTMTISEALSHGYGIQQKGNPGAAVEIYMRVISEKPEHAEAWCYLGMALHDLKRFDESEDAYRQALKLRPKFPVAQNNLGNTLRMLGRMEEALDAFDEALLGRPGYVNALRNKASAHYWSGKLEEAELGFMNVLAEEAENAEARKNLGVLRLLLGRYREGWSDYEYRLKLGISAGPKLEGPFWNGEEIGGKTLMLVSEQGLGDTIQFARYGKLIRERFGCRVIARVQDGLVPLLSGSADLLGLDEVVGIKGEKAEYDVWVTMLSLPGVLDQDAGDFPNEVPYLRSNLDEGMFESVLSGYGRLKVGIAWQGNPANQGDIYRSFPLTAMAPLARLDGVTLFSLQKGQGAEQVKLYGEALGVVDLGPQLDNGEGAFLETAALMKELDLVVTADTAVGHLAGALGIPVWMALPYVPDWRWGLEAEVTPWYPTMRLFRQGEIGKWEPVFEAMAGELDRLRSWVVRREIPKVGTVDVSISPGEFIDRLSILEVKLEKIEDEEKLALVRAEWEALRGVRDQIFGEEPVAEIRVLAVRLKRVNEKLWDAENAVRTMERLRQFSGEFINEARSIYRLNDERAELKRDANELLGARWQEVKSYVT